MKMSYWPSHKTIMYIVIVVGSQYVAGSQLFGVLVVLAIFAKKTAVFSCLTNALAPPPIALESCSTAQTDRPV